MPRLFACCRSFIQRQIDNPYFSRERDRLPIMALPKNSISGQQCSYTGEECTDFIEIERRQTIEISRRRKEEEEDYLTREKIEKIHVCKRSRIDEELKRSLK